MVPRRTQAMVMLARLIIVGRVLEAMLGLRKKKKRQVPVCFFMNILQGNKLKTIQLQIPLESSFSRVAAGNGVAG
jgi:hypothetical protein